MHSCPLKMFLFWPERPRHYLISVTNNKRKGAQCGAQCGGSWPDVLMQYFCVLFSYFNSNIPHIFCPEELNIPGVWWTYSGSLCPVSLRGGVVFATGSCCNSFLFFSPLLLPVNLYLCVCWASQPDASCGVSRALTD